uniref:Uncharacterized protein n=1 Tax=Nelumbo nucifera TaxID=4432 RepID=A0A822ZYC4_NELNU|nr:TPA_asm: hypothetical protein HUJ06_018468 [Nelumbo nucifera]
MMLSKIINKANNKLIYKYCSLILNVQKQSKSHPCLKSQMQNFYYLKLNTSHAFPPPPPLVIGGQSGHIFSIIQLYMKKLMSCPFREWRKKSAYTYGLWHRFLSDHYLHQITTRGCMIMAEVLKLYDLLLLGNNSLSGLHSCQGNT